MSYKKINLEQDTPEWHEYRAMRIGASDAPKIMGVSPWGTAKSVYEEKVGLRINPVTPAMRNGKESESLARECMRLKYGVMLAPCVIESNQYPWMIASLDGMTEGGEIHEIKTPGSTDLDLARRGIIPKHYYPQLQHQIKCAEVEYVMYDVYDKLFDEIYSIRCVRNDEYIADMVKKELEFYERLLIMQPPELSEDEFAEEPKLADLNGIYKREWAAVKEAQAMLKTRMEALERTQNVMIELAGSRNVRWDGVRVKMSKRKGLVDYSKVPELIGVDLEKYRRESSVSWKIEIEKESSG